MSKLIIEKEKEIREFKKENVDSLNMELVKQDNQIKELKRLYDIEKEKNTGKVNVDEIENLYNTNIEKKNEQLIEL